MKSINKVQLIGYVGQQPKNDTLPNGNQILSFSLATSEITKNKNTGEKNKKTDWHQVVFFGETAKTAAIFIKKGSKLYVEGKLSYKTWTNKNGVEVTTTQILGNDFSCLDNKIIEPENKNTNFNANAFDDDILPF